MLCSHPIFDYICVMISAAQIDEAVTAIFDGISFPSEPGGLYDPLRYMIRIGGKRIRPRLCLTAYSLFKDGIGDEILEPAAALEVFHSFTLLHDDIMDKSPLRRGMETVWKKWNEDTAILSGDVMQIDAYKRIAKVPADKLGRALELFSDTAAQVCEGQQYDMEFESVPDVSMPEYEKMIGLKTAVLLACSACLGALIGGASEQECRCLYDYGYELGMAFQVADDYLDAFGDEKVFGKPIGGDIINEKKSWLTVKAMEKTADKAAFQKAFCAAAATPGEKAAKIAAVREMYVSLGVDEDAKREIVRFSGLAMDAVSRMGLDADGMKKLQDFSDRLVGRVK